MALPTAALATIRLDATSITTKLTPANARPIANLVGLDRSSLLRARATQIHANTGASVMTKNDSADCSHSVGTSQPNTVRLVKSCANRLRDVGACSNPAQKIVAKTNRTTITATRFF